MRKLKEHERKLLKKVDFLQWKSDACHREIKVLRRYHIQSREDYTKYNKLCGQIKSLQNKIALLPPTDGHKNTYTSQLLNKLHDLGVVNTKERLSACDDVTVSAFCRRRLPVVLVKLKMCESVKQAVRVIEQGHIRVGVDAVYDPAYLVSRKLEDYVTWVDQSAYKKKILKYNEKFDDYDLM